MRRNTRLDTSNTEQPSRYSFLETPMEMRAPIGISDRQNSPPPPPVPPINPNPMQTGQLNPNPPNEKEHEQEYLRQLQLQQQRAATPYDGPPPLEQHPAHFAPYADDIESPVERPVAPTQQPEVRPPNSPGPVPIKSAPVVEQQTQQGQATSVEPDSNPLQQPFSPVSPLSPHSVTSPVGTFRNINHGPAQSDDIYATHLPGQISHPNQEVKGGTWSHSMCDCSDVGTCCLGLLCPCILYGRTQHRLDMKSRKEDPTNLLAYEKCNGSCTVMALLCGCQWLLATIQHSRTRKAYRIKGRAGDKETRRTPKQSRSSSKRTPGFAIYRTYTDVIPTTS
ncbi:hypothetical protein DTO271D3_5083 [Paecilomyces variotii]|nr:hypothetical protein DTO271D3_5083 [Paecilomyces variotii]KAJ9407274.1 hypothetical protein DTO045G8_5123 [Paecilomyces variotii]